MRITVDTSNPAGVAYHVQSPTGSIVTLITAGTGKLSLQTSGDQRIVVRHAPFHAQGCVTVVGTAQEGRDPEPVIHVDLDQVAYRVTGSQQEQPSQDDIDAVAQAVEEIVQAMATEPTACFPNFVGYAPTEESIFSVAYDYANRLADKNLQVVEALSADVARARTAVTQTQLRYGQAAWKAEETKGKRLELLAARDVDPSAVCRIIHGEPACGNKHTATEFRKALRKRTAAVTDLFGHAA